LIKRLPSKPTNDSTLSRTNFQDECQSWVAQHQCVYKSRKESAVTVMISLDFLSSFVKVARKSMFLTEGGGIMGFTGSRRGYRSSKRGF